MLVHWKEKPTAVSSWSPDLASQPLGPPSARRLAHALQGSKVHCRGRRGRPGVGAGEAREGSIPGRRRNSPRR